MDQNDTTGDHRNKPAPTTPYNGRVMVVSVGFCFAVLLIIAFFHLNRLYWGHPLHRSAQLRRRRCQSWSHEQASAAAGSSTAATGKGQGLPAAVLQALPTFQFSASPGGEAECAVCLSEFEDGETGRVLPDCKHWFHVDCIDMWFATHSSCPLCRAPVEPDSGGFITLPTVWSPFIRDRKLPELTSIRVEAPEEAAGGKHHCPGCSSGSDGPAVDPK